MADDVMEGAAGEGTPPKRGRKKLLLFIIIGVFVLLIAGAAAVYFSGMLSAPKSAAAQEAAAKEGPKVQIFYDLPDLLVNLNAGGKKASFLKIVVSLELPSSEDQPKVKAVEPRIVDTFQTYLRELRPEDLRGSVGLARLREELLIRVNATLAPIKVDDVLFREMLVQ